MTTPLRRQTVEAILRDIARDILWLQDRCRREGETGNGWNAEQIRKLESQASRLRAELEA